MAEPVELLVHIEEPVEGFELRRHTGEPVEMVEHKLVEQWPDRPEDTQSQVLQHILEAEKLELGQQADKQLGDTQVASDIRAAGMPTDNLHLRR